MRNRHLFLLDAAALVVAPVIAFLVRFEDFSWLGQNLRMVLPYILLAGPVRLFAFYNLGMYRRLWRHASIGELKQILVAGGIAAIFAALIGFWIMPASQISASRVPFSVVFIDAFLTTAALALPRLLARTIRIRDRRRGRATEPGRPALIVGAGDTAKLVAKELIANPRLGFEPIGFVDDDPTKQNHMLLELPVMGTLSAIIGERYREMIRGDAEAARGRTLGEMRALSGVSSFLARVKCALLAWSALDEGINRRG